MISLGVNGGQYNTFDPALFGGNFLFNRDNLGEDSPFGRLTSEIGVTSFRYPGGSVTERLFDISDPDRTSGYDYERGETANLTPLSDFMDFAAEAAGSVTIVIPTRQFLSVSTDENGDRYPDFDYAELTNFVRDVAQGVYGDARIDAFEIGNEYWGSGEMSSVEYGRLASEMAHTIETALSDVSTPSGNDIDIVVQSGTNFNHARLDDEYSAHHSPAATLAALSQDYGINFDRSHLSEGGNVSWTAVNNTLIRNEFNEDEFEALDGIATHVYSRGEANLATRDYSLQTIEDTWIRENPDLETYVTEWNLMSSRGVEENDAYGLRQAHEMLNLLEEFSEHGVDSAHVWPLIQSTRNAISHGWDGEELTPAGQMFDLMQDSLPGTRPLSLVGSQEDQNELRAPGLDVHSFGSPEQLVLFLASTTGQVTSSEIDISGIATGGAAVSVSFLGVEDGQEPTNPHATGVIEVPSEEEISSEIFVGDIIRADLDAFEIMQVVIDNPAWTPAMQGFWNTVGDDDTIIFEQDEPDIPTIPEIPHENPPLAREGDEEEADDGGGGIEGLLGIVLFLPFLLGLGGLGG